MYTPPHYILDRYASILVNIALNSGSGIKTGDVVRLLVPDAAKPLALALQNAVLRSGGHPLTRLLPTGFDKDFYTLANQEQLTFFPRNFLRAEADLIDHQIYIVADVDPRELSHVNPMKIIEARDAKKEFRDWLTEKEVQEKFTWTIALWGTQAKAAEVGLTYRQYWNQIIQACFLDKPDPKLEWQKTLTMQMEIKTVLNAMDIGSLCIKGKDVDLTIRLGPERLWNGGSGRNIPSFEFFTSPDWRGTQGWIHFNQPLYRYGNVLKDIDLEFHHGIVVKAKAKSGDAFLQQMLKSPNANKLGEFSLTDKRMSRITHVMAETLYDENIGGPYGNTHVALGKSYKDCYRGDAKLLKKKDWEDLGFNESAEHTDIISTTDRTVTAKLSNNAEVVIYKDGMFPFYKG